MSNKTKKASKSTKGTGGGKLARSTGRGKRRKVAAATLFVWRAARGVRKLRRSRRRSAKVARRGVALASGAVSVGSLAVGALALGALAIGALAIRRLAIRRAAIDKLDVRDLKVGRLEVDELIVHSDRRSPEAGGAEG
jgi:hypothetical protein